MNELVFESNSLAETIRFGERLAEMLRPGDVVALIGNLGAGKTHLTQAVAGKLGVPSDEITSPTFVLLQEYAADIPICHFDTYRLRDTDEFLELGADELLGADNICLIEWADRVLDVLPKSRIEVHITVTGEETRDIKIRCPGNRRADFLALLLDS